MTNLKLTIELVPKTSWYNNVRSNVSKSEWDIIRKHCYKMSGYKCEICNRSKSIECHEIWQYNDFNHIQTLIGLISLCKDCHRVKHVGLAKIRYEEKLVENQLMIINKWSRKQAIEYIINSFDTWNTRSNHDWTIDILFINDYIKQSENSKPTIF